MADPIRIRSSHTATVGSRRLGLRTMVGAAFVFAVANTAVDADTARSVAQSHFFPSRPAGAVLHSLTGTLTDFSIGNDEGGFEVVAGKKKFEIYVSSDFRIDGKPAPCDQAPERGQPPDPSCKWPSNIVVGKTRVTTAFWLQKKQYDPRLVMVADEFHVAAPGER